MLLLVVIATISINKTTPTISILNPFSKHKRYIRGIAIPNVRLDILGAGSTDKDLYCLFQIWQMQLTLLNNQMDSLTTRMHRIVQMYMYLF